MALPDATLTIRDGALGIAPENTDNVVALIGASSSGTAGSVYAFTDIQTLKDTLGTGPLVEAAALILAVAGGKVLCVKPATSAGTNGSVTHGGTGVSVMSVTGNPLDAYDVIVKMVAGGTNPAAGTATFQYSLDGGKSYSIETAVPTGGSYPIPGTGLTAVFTAATLVAADTYTFSSTSPSYSVGQFNTAFDALAADAQTWFLCWVVGVPADGTASAALFAALDSKLTAAATAYRYAMGLIAAQADTSTAVRTTFSALTSKRVGVSFGFANVTSPISGNQYKREVAYLAAMRAAEVGPEVELGRVDDGPLAGVTALVEDEFKAPGADAAGFITARTHLGLRGFFLTNGRIMAGTGSDFQFIPMRRVMDIAASTVRTEQLQYVNSTVRVRDLTAAAPGTILETDARDIERRLAAALRARVGAYVSDLSVQVDRTVNMLSLQKLVIRYRLTPLATARTVEGEIGFLNPALTPVVQAA